MSLEKRYNTFAIQQFSFGLFYTGHFENCRIHINAYYRRIGDSSGLNDAGPANKHRLTNSAFVEHSLASAQGLVRSYTFNAAVVGKEENNGVVSKAHLVEFVNDTPNTQVGALNHSGVFRIVLPVRAGFFLIFIYQLLFGVQWCVNGVMRQVKKEGFVLVGFNKFQRLIRKSIGEVFARRTIRKLGIIIGDKITFYGMACAVAGNVDIKALSYRTELRIITKMPFTNTGTYVTGGLDGLGNGYNF